MHTGLTNIIILNKELDSLIWLNFTEPLKIYSAKSAFLTFDSE